MQRLFCIGMQLAHQLGGIVFSPADWAAFQVDQRASKLASQVITSYRTDRNKFGLFENTRFYLQSRERLRDRLYFILDQLFVPKQADWSTIPLSRVFFPFYYLIRPLRLLGKFGWSLFKRNRIFFNE
jgi:hypothetical protein